MLYRRGDPEVLDRVAGELMTCAREVETVGGASAEALTVIRCSWGGDADAADTDWGRFAVARSCLTTSLETLATRLRRTR